ncbi:MAG: hypothetical protein IPH04_01405 [Saprospirales bacterium]|nr:hypothetical protein [Saprospirales bacterium]
MADIPILDDFAQSSSHASGMRIQKIFIGAEIGLWVLALLELALSEFLDMRFPIDLSFFPYRLWPGFTFLALFYVIFPVWLFGSEGWKRHIGSHLTGLFIAAGTFFGFMRIDRVFDDSAQANEGTFDICMGLLEISYIPLFLTGLVFLIRKFSPRGRKFFWAVLLRLILVTGLLAFAIWEVG